jgi:hypothetical protein
MSAPSDKVHNLHLVRLLDHRPIVIRAADDRQVVLDRHAAGINAEALKERRDGDRRRQVVRLPVQMDAHALKSTTAHPIREIRQIRGCLIREIREIRGRLIR